MKKSLSTQFILLTLLLFSCQFEEVFQKEELTSERLRKEIIDMPSFRSFLGALGNSTKSPLAEINGLDKKDEQWLDKLFEKFPSYADFKQEAAPKTQDKFKKLMSEAYGDHYLELDAKFRLLSHELRKSFIFQEAELIRALNETLTQSQLEIAKSFPFSCELVCEGLGYGVRFNAYQECMAEVGEQGPCAEEARMAADYFVEGCKRGCNHEE